MSEKEMAEAVLICFRKGYISDLGDNDYFCEESEETIDEAYVMLEELQEYGSKAFEQKYKLFNH